MRYSATGSISEFKTMVKRLHSAGLEVILDVVYNHTAEGNHLGPTLSFRGIDNAAYYRLVPDDPRYYMDFTGTGNTLNMMHPRVLQLIMDSLRYWILEMHVDGFRFDLASALARQLYEVDQLSSFFTIIHQDPVISQAKLIAEPWDVGEGGYQVGNFPVGWAEWNGKYRDVDARLLEGRRRARGRARLPADRLERPLRARRTQALRRASTSSRPTTASPCATSSPTTRSTTRPTARTTATARTTTSAATTASKGRPTIRRSDALRARQRRNIMATLLLSQGVPMLLSGDEIGRTQGGNNNAYCQDNEMSWLDWDLSDPDRNFLAFVRRMIRLRKEHPAFRRRTSSRAAS